MSSVSRPSTRRTLLASWAAGAGVWLLGCGDESRGSQPSDGNGGNGGTGAGVGGGDCGAAQDGELIETLSFVNEGDAPFGQLVKEGWDARLYTDLSKVAAGALVTPNELFYVRTEYPDLLDPTAPWSIAVSGLVAQPSALSLADLEPLVADQGVHVMECSGNSVGAHFGLLSAAGWSGAPMKDVLALLSIDPRATRVLVSGFDGHSVPSENNHSTPGASWIFTFDQLERAFLATEMNGEALPKDHGAPVRLLVPGWYGCTCIKWVNEIVLVDDSASATSQMKEFASRTHQDGVPELARDYKPASMDQAAMPVVAERWRVGKQDRIRMTGILWGGYEPTAALEVRVGQGAWEPVDVCPPMATNQTWTVWSHELTAAVSGIRPVVCRIADPAIPTRRLDQGYYAREIDFG